LGLCCCRCCLSDVRLTDENGSINVRRIIFENELNDGRDNFLLITGVVIEFVSLVDVDISKFVVDVGLLSVVDVTSSCILLLLLVGVVVDDDDEVKVFTEQISVDRLK
jgi:hypothetical protein